MSSYPGDRLENFLDDMYSIARPTAADIEKLVEIWAEQREYVERKLAEFWEQEEQGWRSYRNNVFYDSIPQEVWDKSELYLTSRTDQSPESDSTLVSES